MGRCSLFVLYAVLLRLDELRVEQMDIVTAVLYGLLDEDGYVTQPDGFISAGGWGSGGAEDGLHGKGKEEARRKGKEKGREVGE